MSEYCQCAYCQKEFNEPSIFEPDEPVCPFCGSTEIIYDVDALNQELSEDINE